MSNEQRRCLCISSNARESWQTEPVARLTPPFPDTRDDVPVDACIAGAIYGLWTEGVWTLGSCCGHNKVNPSVVLAHWTDGEKAISHLAADGRDWDVLAWQLMPLKRGDGDE